MSGEEDFFYIKIRDIFTHTNNLLQKNKVIEAQEYLLNNLIPVLKELKEVEKSGSLVSSGNPMDNPQFKQLLEKQQDCYNRKIEGIVELLSDNQVDESIIKQIRPINFGSSFGGYFGNSFGRRMYYY